MIYFVWPAASVEAVCGLYSDRPLASSRWEPSVYAAEPSDDCSPALAHQYLPSDKDNHIHSLENVTKHVTVDCAVPVTVQVWAQDSGLCCSCTYPLSSSFCRLPRSVLDSPSRWRPPPSDSAARPERPEEHSVMYKKIKHLPTGFQSSGFQT